MRSTDLGDFIIPPSVSLPGPTTVVPGVSGINSVLRLSDWTTLPLPPLLQSPPRCLPGSSMTSLSLRCLDPPFVSFDLIPVLWTRTVLDYYTGIYSVKRRTRER